MLLLSATFFPKQFTLPARVLFTKPTILLSTLKPFSGSRAPQHSTRGPLQFHSDTVALSPLPVSHWQSQHGALDGRNAWGDWALRSEWPCGQLGLAVKHRGLQESVPKTGNLHSSTKGSALAISPVAAMGGHLIDLQLQDTELTKGPGAALRKQGPPSHRGHPSHQLPPASV